MIELKTQILILYNKYDTWIKFECLSIWLVISKFSLDR